MSRRDRSLPANASGLDSHRASITGRCGQVFGPALIHRASAAQMAKHTKQDAVAVGRLLTAVLKGDAGERSLLTRRARNASGTAT
jgi:hypothetical protein